MHIDTETRERISERFGTDADFRDQLIDNPGATLKEHFGLDLPFPIRFVADGTNYRIEPLSGEGEPLILDAPSFGEGQIFSRIIGNNGQT